MKVDHAKSVLNAILEGCEDEHVIKELIDTAWRLIRAEPKSIPIKGEVTKRKPRQKSKAVTVNDRDFTSVTAACKFYDMLDCYKTVCEDLNKGVHPEDIFPKEPPTPKIRMNVDERNGLVLPN